MEMDLFAETSCLTGQGVEEMIEEIARCLYEKAMLRPATRASSFAIRKEDS